MANFYDEMNESSPTYKLHRKDTILWVGMTVAVLFLAYFFIWQIKASAVKKIDTQIAAARSTVTQGSKAEQKLNEFEQAAKTDPVGFDLSNFVDENYENIAAGTYFILAALSFAVVARFVAFVLMTFKRNKYYPSDKELEEFLGTNFSGWKDFYARVREMRHFGCAFWKVLKQSATVVNDSRKYDHLYLHMRNRFDKVVENIHEVALYESIATASPAAGFFGTLIGLLLIFTQNDGGAAALAQSPQFVVGLKVALITSLWGLVNLGAAILFAYFTRKVTESIFDRMV